MNEGAYLIHHGILGMKWGVRRYQNPDGSLTDRGRKRLLKQDEKWAKKNADKITSKTKKAISRDLDAHAQKLLQDPSSYKDGGRRLSSTAINSYNRKMAELMNQAVGEITSPSGRVVQFVAKRGQTGVYMALADQGYNIGQLKNGVWASGRVAYKKKQIDMM